MILSVPAAVLVDAILSFLAAAIERRPAICHRTARWWFWLPGPWRRAHITIGWTLWVAEGTVGLMPASAVGLLAHEGTHWLQRHRHGRWGFAWRYAMPWMRVNLEAEAYAVEAHAYDAMGGGDTDALIEDMGAAMGGWLYLLGPGPHADRIRTHYACPNHDMRAWLGLVERAAQAARA